MKIAVCVKHISDPESPLLTKASLPITENADIPFIINPVDENAVEEALRIKERLGGQVMVFSLGAAGSETTLRHTLALGADDAILISDGALAEANAYGVGLALARALELAGGFDLVLCGDRSGDGGTGLVGAVIAERLGMALVTAACQVEVAADGSARVQRLLEGGNRQVVQAALPAVIGVLPGLNQPRYPTLLARRNAQRKEIAIWNLAQLGLSPEEAGVAKAAFRVVSLSPPRPRSQKLFAPDPALSGRERLRLVLSGGPSRSNAGQIWEGEPETIAEQLVDYLRQHRFLGAN